MIECMHVCVRGCVSARVRNYEEKGVLSMRVYANKERCIVFIYVYRLLHIFACEKYKSSQSDQDGNNFEQEIYMTFKYSLIYLAYHFLNFFNPLKIGVTHSSFFLFSLLFFCLLS